VKGGNEMDQKEADEFVEEMNRMEIKSIYRADKIFAMLEQTTAVTDKQYMRMKLWCDVVTTVAGLSTVGMRDTPIEWADRALEQFDIRFKDEK
jgi:hypothetical protein